MDSLWLAVQVWHSLKVRWYGNYRYPKSEINQDQNMGSLWLAVQGWDSVKVEMVLCPESAHIVHRRGAGKQARFIPLSDSR
eukprot:11730224-Heterocapsa_arctica.AAC.1